MTKAVVWRCSLEQVFLKYLQNFKENISWGDVFGKVTGWMMKAYKFVKKRLQHRGFPVNFAIFLKMFICRTPVSG